MTTQENETYFRMTLQRSGCIRSQTDEGLDGLHFVVGDTSQELCADPLVCQDLLDLVRFAINLSPQLPEWLGIWLP